ncbi:MAG TPA: type 1 glutamine amidotransferase domain-containing protein [Solirubrobacteraceae bacterium]|jgi:putative intracellular protease/amidase|nr:type 1 glutamine amidotransferase domain-containing protein [Solirubrobacteraceae bacterium]
MSSSKRVLMVVANSSVSALTGWPIGFWASELTHPWYEFREGDHEVVVASPEGGEVRVDGLSDPRDESGYSAGDVLSRGFLADPKLSALLADTPRLAALDLDAFDAIVACGGQGPMYQFREHEELKRAIARFHAAGKPTAALCHGVSALIDVRLADSSWLVEGRTVTGFANIEEDASNEAAGQTVQPWRIEDALRERGAEYVRGGLWQPFAVSDGNLITGQQQHSGRKVAELVLEALA